MRFRQGFLGKGFFNEKEWSIQMGLATLHHAAFRHDLVWFFFMFCVLAFQIYISWFQKRCFFSNSAVVAKAKFGKYFVRFVEGLRTRKVASKINWSLVDVTLSNRHFVSFFSKIAWLIDALGLSQIFFPTQNLVRTY